jgi:intein-encoded DNA endonuclease-like protein
MDLLRRLGIESTGPRISVQRRTVFYDTRRGKKYTHNKDVYVIYIRASSNINFYRYVGFTITRKQARLENYDKRNRNTSTPTLPQPFPNPSSK